MLICFRFEATLCPDNLRLIEARGGREVARLPQRGMGELSWPPLRWTGEESYMCRMVSPEGGGNKVLLSGNLRVGTCVSGLGGVKLTDPSFPCVLLSTVARVLCLKSACLCSPCFQCRDCLSTLFAVGRRCLYTLNGCRCFFSARAFLLSGNLLVDVCFFFSL